MPAKPKKVVGPGQSPSKRRQKPCPICGKPAKEDSRPFCSERCRDVDLNRWLSNSYAIPGRKDEDEDAD
jgi:uncharacterized protein